jgi:acetyl-CoA acyltransferase
MGLTAETLASRYGIDRDAQDAYAFGSQRKAGAAQAEGRLAAEIAPVGDIAVDGCPRLQTTIEGLGQLKTVFKADGSVTAGNSSPLTDGASATLVCSEGYARRHGLTPLARVAGYAVSGCAPEIMGIGPVEATRKALARAGIGSGDLDIIEMNEAFAAQVLACLREWKVDPTDERLNPNGSGISLGHPVGATGARILATMAHELQRRESRYALETMCIGGGQGLAAVFERVAP